MSEPKKKFERLPKTIIPSHYDIWLMPNLTDFTFKGKLTVYLQVKEPTDTIVCNSAELTVEDIQIVRGEDGESVTVDRFEFRESDELLFIYLASNLPLGEAKLSCCFTGILNDRLIGFYRSKYIKDGEDRFAAVTQFAAAEARRCFPCWDEPAIKSTFTLTVTAPTNRTVHSNMPEISEEIDPGNAENKIVYFEKSPKMSTYLLALVVGEFEAVEGKSEEGILVRVYTPIGKKHQGQFALDVSIKSITFYKNFFGISYPLSKYDCIAIADFSCGAMENWGLVTYRESVILVDPEQTSAGSKQRTANTVAHEMAHQWFGNLVTMEWWTHLWLNEGFARFMQSVCLSHLFPEFSIWSQFVADVLITALDLDALNSSHPIEVAVGPPSEVDEIFDLISYNKGGSILRMLYGYIGDEAFRSGMQHYLTKFAYSNTETGDLWACLEESSKKPIDKIMSTWTSQMGFPVISVESSVIEDGKKTLTLRQSKFNADGSKSSGYLWVVPINILSSNGATNDVLLETESATIVLEDCAADEWFKLNPGFEGFYRVNYAPTDLALMMPAIKDQVLGEVDRLHLLNDTYALVKAGRASTDFYLELLQAYKNDKSYVVWSSICGSVSELQNLVAHTIFYDEFKIFVVDLLSNILQTVGWEKNPEESHVQGLLRSLIITKMGVLGHEETLAEARKRFACHLTGASPIVADLRVAVYNTVMANGDFETFGHLQKLLRSTDLNEEKLRLAGAMGVCRDRDVLEKVLEYFMSDDIRSQDTPNTLANVGVNPKGKDSAWNLLKSNYSTFMARYKAGMLMNRLIKVTTENFVTLERASEIEAFFKENINPAERVVKQSVENIRLNAAWLERDGEKIRKFLVTRTHSK